jgi:hypothetical protein
MTEVDYGVVRHNGAWSIIGKGLHFGAYKSRSSAERADSDDAAHLFRDDRAHHSEMMPPIRGVFVGGLI